MHESIKLKVCERTTIDDGTSWSIMVWPPDTSPRTKVSKRRIAIAEMGDALTGVAPCQQPTLEFHVKKSHTHFRWCVYDSAWLQTTLQSPHFLNQSSAALAYDEVRQEKQHKLPEQESLGKFDALMLICGWRCSNCEQSLTGTTSALPMKNYRFLSHTPQRLIWSWKL